MAKEYNILSPDGFPISPENFPTPEKAWEYFNNKWMPGYKAQGYYSTIDNNVRIEIAPQFIKNYCKLITYKTIDDD